MYGRPNISATKFPCAIPSGNVEKSRQTVRSARRQASGVLAVLPTFGLTDVPRFAQAGGTSDMLGIRFAPDRPIFEEYVSSFGLNDRFEFIPGDFFRDPLPKADVLSMGHILHDWHLDQKKVVAQ